MKKFLSISMMALALVFASSCSKDEEPSAEKCVNTWVTDELALTEIVDVEDIFGDKVPAELQPVLAAQLNNLKFKVALDFAADGNGKGGVVIEKTKLNLVETAIQALLTQYADKLKPEELAKLNELLATVKPMLDNLKDGDLVGAQFTYSATPTDSESGRIVATYKDLDEEGNPKDETMEFVYSGLSDNTITLTSVTEGKTESISFKSAASANVTIGNFVDVAALGSLIEK